LVAWMPRIYEHTAVHKYVQLHAVTMSRSRDVSFELLVTHRWATWCLCMKRSPFKRKSKINHDGRESLN
jgi:hypothetical protein